MKKGEKMPPEMSLIKFMERFGTNEQCAEDLFLRRFGENGEKFVCPKCGGRHFYRINGRLLAQCKDKYCRHQVSMLVGTVMENSKMEVRKWYLAMHLMTVNKSGISSKTLQRELSVTYKTAWYVHKRIASVMKIADEKYFLDELVDVDEAYMSGRSGEQKRGRGTNKTKVIVALSKTKSNKPKFLKMQVVTDFRAKTLSKFAEKNILPGSTLQTDGFRAYRSQIVTKNYIHNFEVTPPDSPDNRLKWLHHILGNCTQIILGTYHGLRQKHLQDYLDEFCYRFNRRNLSYSIWDKLLNSALLSPPVSYYSKAVALG